MTPLRATLLFSLSTFRKKADSPVSMASIGEEEVQVNPSEDSDLAPGSNVYDRPKLLIQCHLDDAQ